jgi:hypothetical protein
MPEKIRLDLYAEEQQRLGKQQKPPGISIANPPIYIINTLPTSPCQTCYPGPSLAPIASSIPSIDVPGFRDEEGDKYYAWHESKVREEEQKEEYRKACRIMKRDYMDLKMLYQEPDPDFLIKEGVKKWPALHAVCDIDKWVRETKRIRTEE